MLILSANGLMNYFHMTTAYEADWEQFKSLTEAEFSILQLPTTE